MRPFGLMAAGQVADDVGMQGGTSGDVRAPWWPVAAQAAAVALAVAAVVVTTATGSYLVPATAVGYVLGAVVVVVLSGVYRAARDGLRGDGSFRPQPWLDRLVVALVVLGLAAGMVNAFALATELAK